jgi:hypothetical protein
MSNSILNSKWETPWVGHIVEASSNHSASTPPPMVKEWWFNKNTHLFYSVVIVSKTLYQFAKKHNLVPHLVIMISIDKIEGKTFEARIQFHQCITGSFRCHKLSQEKSVGMNDVSVRRRTNTSLDTGP